METTDGKWSSSGVPTSVDGGLVTVGVPQYFNPNTHQSASTHVLISLTQGKETSAPINVSIEDLPTLGALGTKIGFITDGYYRFLELELGQQIGALQALEASPGNTVNTLPQQSSLRTELRDVMLARWNVDQVMNNPSLALPVVVLPHGLKVRFDATSVAEMDRVLGWQLLNCFPARSSPREGGHTPHSPLSSITKLVNELSTSPGAMSAAQSTQGSVAIKGLGTIIGGVSSALGITLDGLIGETGAVVVAGTAVSAGAALGLAMTFATVGVFATVAGVSLIGVAVNSANPNVQQQYINDAQAAGIVAMDAAQGQATSWLVGQVSQDAGQAYDLATEIDDVLDATDELKSEFYGASLTSDTQQNASSLSADQAITDAGAEEVGNSLSSGDPLVYALLNGEDSVLSSGIPASSDPQASITLSCSSSPSQQLSSTMVDSSGNYSAIVPITTIPERDKPADSNPALSPRGSTKLAPRDEPGCITDITVASSDPFTNQAITEVSLDVSGLSDANPDDAPPMASSCRYHSNPLVDAACTAATPYPQYSSPPPPPPTATPQPTPHWYSVGYDGEDSGTWSVGGQSGPATFALRGFMETLGTQVVPVPYPIASGDNVYLIALDDPIPGPSPSPVPSACFQSGGMLILLTPVNGTVTLNGLVDVTFSTGATLTGSNPSSYDTFDEPAFTSDTGCQYSGFSLTSVNVSNFPEPYVRQHR